jgi:C1A family cysteine protease
MPIRMTDDEDNESSNSKKKDSGSSGFSILTIFNLFGSLIFKYPKIMIPVLLVGGLFYASTICIGGDGSNESVEFPTENERNDKTIQFKGAKFDLKKYAKTPVYEPLAKGYGNEIPSSFSLLKYAPERKNQGQQGSCTGWAISYSARTILQAQATGENPNTIAFSPGYLFNQSTDSNCGGAYPIDLLEVMKKQGDLSLSDFPYDENSCRTKPNKQQREQANTFRIDGYQRLTAEGDNYKTDIESLKQYISNGSPVVISMDVGGSFGNLRTATWFPTNKDYREVKEYQRDFKGDDWGGHAMTAIGYDDNHEGGAVQIMNSWGEEFGEKGIFWLRYQDFDKFVQEAFSIYPLATTIPNRVRTLRFGLVENKLQNFIQLTKIDDFTYRTSTPIAKGTRFKVSIENDTPVYVYIFGMESDGSSYVLFPYNEKHSAYCGPKGVRVFPSKQSLEADNIGKRDSVSVIFANELLDAKKINDQINSSQGKNFGEKIKSALTGKLSTSRKLGEGGDFIELTTDEKDIKKVNALIIEFDKI